jgi:hypothetical protein
MMELLYRMEPLRRVGTYYGDTAPYGDTVHICDTVQNGDIVPNGDTAYR